MIEYFIDYHHVLCPVREKNRNEYQEYAAMNCLDSPRRFLFFAGNKFFLITYFHCMEMGGHLEWKQELIQEVVGKYEIISRGNVERAWDVEKQLKKWRNNNGRLRKLMMQVNYLYSDATGKDYAITTTLPFIEAICNSSEIDKNYQDAIRFLNEKGYTWLIESCTELRNYNDVLANVSDIEICRTTDYLIEKIKQLI